MSESIISEGKTTQEAIENGLKILNCSKDQVEINILENKEKRSFFSILSPRVVKVEMRLKENLNTEPKKEELIEIDNLQERKEKIEKFLEDFKNKSNIKMDFSVEANNNYIDIKITGDEIGYLIGYRGDTLNSLQVILSAIANINYSERVKIFLDIGGYKEKRKQILEDLAVKISKTVLRTGRSIKLEPMMAYERKIIHTKLQGNPNISTKSIGEEPNRRIVVSKINK